MDHKALKEKWKRKKYSVHASIVICLLLLIMLTGTVNLLTAHAAQSESVTAEADIESSDDGTDSTDHENEDEITAWLDENSGFLETVWSAIKSFFVSVWEFIVDFVTGLVKLIIHKM